MNLIEQIRKLVADRKAAIKPMFANNKASQELANDQKAAADILGEIAISAIYRIGDDPEDASVLMTTDFVKKTRQMLRNKAELDAQNAEFDGEKWSTYNPANSIVNAADKFGFEGAEDTYQEFFEEFTPDLNECPKCNSDFVGEDCPTCENRRFESDHAKGKI